MKDPERFQITETKLTDDQEAMLLVLGAPEEARTTIRLYTRATAEILKRYPEAKHHVVVNHDCPIVTYRGRRRMILPNGDVSTCKSEYIARSDADKPVQ